VRLRPGVRARRGRRSHVRGDDAGGEERHQPPGPGGAGRGRPVARDRRYGFPKPLKPREPSEPRLAPELSTTWSAGGGVTLTWVPNSNSSMFTVKAMLGPALPGTSWPTLADNRMRRSRPSLSSHASAGTWAEAPTPG